MREFLACLAVLGLAAACSKAPATNAPQLQANAAPAATAPAATPAAAVPATGPAVSGQYVAGGKAATLTEVTAHNDEPFDGKPVIALVFTEKPQGGDPKAADDAHSGQFGEAIVLRVQPDGVVIGSDLIHSGLAKSGGYVSGVGMVMLKNYSAAGGQISGQLTSGGPTDAFGQPINVDLTFHAKAP